MGNTNIEAVDLDLLVSVSSDLGVLLINEQGEKKYEKSVDCLGRPGSGVPLHALSMRGNSMPCCMPGQLHALCI